MVQLFSWFGTVLEAEIIFHARVSLGYGFVTMANREEANLVLTSLHNSVIDKRVVRVNLATPKKSAVPVDSKDPTAPASPARLVLAEVRLEQARLDMKRMREELPV